MPQFAQVLALAAVPALGIVAGALLAEVVVVSQRTLSLALHTAAGIVLGAVSIELAPRGFGEISHPWVAVLAFLGGAVFYLLVDAAIDIVGRRRGASTGGGGVLLAAGTSVELFSDGVMIATGTSVGFTLGLLLALAQAPGNMPEGFATMATFKRDGWPRRRRLLVAAGFAVPIPLGAAVGYFGVRGQPEDVGLALLAFTAGLLVTVTVEQIVPEAHEARDSRTATLLLVAGFALFALLALYLD